MMRIPEGEKELFEIFLENDRSAYFKHIKRAIGLVKELDLSFWKDGQFLRWQLMRLNRNYQSHVYNVWIKAWELEDPEEKVWVRDKFYLFEEYLPKPGVSFADWINEQNNQWWEAAATEQDPDVQADVAEDIETIKLRVIETMAKDYEENRNMIEHLVLYKADRILADKPEPIPWVYRFPSWNSLSEIPPFPGEGKKMKGRPQEWAINLLVYELSQTGLKNMEIARLLFGIEKSTLNYPDKDPVLVRINDIKKRVNKAVTQAYPLPEST